MIFAIKLEQEYYLQQQEYILEIKDTQIGKEGVKLYLQMTCVFRKS